MVYGHPPPPPLPAEHGSVPTGMRGEEGPTQTGQHRSLRVYSRDTKAGLRRDADLIARGGGRGTVSVRAQPLVDHPEAELSGECVWQSVIGVCACSSSVAVSSRKGHLYIPRLTRPLSGRNRKGGQVLNKESGLDEGAKTVYVRLGPRDGR